MPYRIAFCTTELRAGGAERCLVELATRLDPAKFSCSVVSLAPRPAEDERSLAPRLESAGIPLHFLNARGMRDAWRALRELTALWRGTRPDLVQTFLFHANILGRVAARRAGVGTIVSGIRVAERRYRSRLWIDRLTARHVARHVCVSESVRRFSVDEGRLPAERVVVIPNGIDVARYEQVAELDRSSLGLAPGRRFVVCIGRLDEQKGQRWLLTHAATWLDQLPAHDLVFVGDGPDREELERLAAEKVLTSRVRFAGWRKDVPSILRAADLLVLPSRWEGMPNVVLEAMAAGRPVVAREVEGVRELLGPAANDQVASRDDAQLLSQQIVAILSSSEKRAELGAKNLMRARGEFSYQRMVGDYGALYNALLQHTEK